MQNQINFQGINEKFDRLENFMLEILRQKNPEGFKKFQEEQEKK